jgi:hypothetical protein
VCLFLSLSITGELKAQVTGSLSGRVEDPSSTGVSGATITVRSLESGATRTTTTDAEGDYTVLSLPLGPQEVRAEKSGFKAALRTGIDLIVGQDAVVNLRLEVGDLAQQIVVSEEVPVVNTTTSPVSGVVNERQVKDLPLNGRSFDDLLALNPGALNYVLKSAGTSTSNGNTFSVDGRRPAENLFLLNGIEYAGTSQLAVTPGGVSGELLGVDAVREFNALTDTYGAEYGKRAGAQVSVVTQSGTNALHGTLFEFFRNSALDAPNFFAAPAAFLRRNQFGAALGGPLKKNVLFLFGNWEELRWAQSTTTPESVVPDLSARQGLLPNAAGVPTPVAGLNPAMLAYMQLWPLPNGPDLGGGSAISINNPAQIFHEDFGTLHSDYILSRRDTLTGSYTIDNGNSVLPQADPLFASGQALRMQVASIQETHVFSPSLLNTFNAGYSRAGFNYDSDLLTSFASGLSFVEGASPGGIVIGGGATTTGTGTITSAGPNNAANVWNRRGLFTERDDVQWIHGIHQISAGVWFQRLDDNEDTASRQLGQATFTSLQTLLQGTVSTFQVVPDPNELGWRSFFGAAYLQDVIRLRKTLTLSLGLRDEFTTGWNEVSGRASNYLTNGAGVLQTNPVVGNSLFTQNNATHLLSPRVGLAWDVFGNGKTAFRGGFGTYYSLIDALAFLVNSVPPYNGSVSFSNVALSSIVPIIPSVPPAPSCGPGVPSPCTTYAPQGVQPNAKTPTVQEWNLTLEQQLDPNTSLRLAYVGSFGYHGLLSVDPNSIPAEVCASAAGCLAGGTGTTHTTVPQGAQYIPAGTRPNPYLSGGFFWYTEGNSSYNALQIDVIRRLSRGLSIRGNFTWSKSLDFNSGLTGAQASNQAQMILDRNDLGRDWGPSALDIEHAGVISGSYLLPLGKGRLREGWQVNAIATMLSGFPFTPQVGSNRSGDGDTRNPDRPNLNPAFTGPVITGNANQWFNPNAFLLPAAGTYGNLGRGTFTGPGLANLDFSLFKSIQLRERTNLQFRAEAFNILNHTNFGTPNATVFSSGAISPTAGLITTTATTSRQIQLGLKLMF